VIKDLGLKEPYRGIVRLLTGEIAEDIAYYFSESEQIPSAVGLGVFVNPDGKVSAAGGFLVQSLPPSEERTVEQLMENIRSMPFVTDLLREGKTPEDILAMIFSGIPYHLLGRRDLSLRCTCSRERIERVLISLGSEELQRIISDQGETDVTCEFCRTTYHFTSKELEDLRREISPAH
jgi:molecular chaperone Hsp33